MKELRSFTISELKTIFKGTSSIAADIHERDIDLYIQRGENVENKTLIADILKNIERPHTTNDMGFKAEVSIKVYGGAYKSHPYDEEYLWTHNGYTYYLNGVDFNVKATDVNGSNVRAYIPVLNRVKIKDYNDLENYPKMLSDFIFIDPTDPEADVSERIRPFHLLCSNNIDSCLSDINKDIKYVLSRTDNYKNNFIAECLEYIEYYKNEIKNTPISHIEKYLTKSQVRKYGIEQAKDNFIYNENKSNNIKKLYIDQLVCIMDIIKINTGTFENILNYSPYKGLKLN